MDPPRRCVCEITLETVVSICVRDMTAAGLANSVGSGLILNVVRDVELIA